MIYKSWFTKKSQWRKSEITASEGYKHKKTSLAVCHSLCFIHTYQNYYQNYVFRRKLSYFLYFSVEQRKKASYHFDNIFHPSFSKFSLEWQTISASSTDKLSFQVPVDSKCVITQVQSRTGQMEVLLAMNIVREHLDNIFPSAPPFSDKRLYSFKRRKKKRKLRKTNHLIINKAMYPFLGDTDSLRTLLYFHTSKESDSNQRDDVECWLSSEPIGAAHPVLSKCRSGQLETATDCKLLAKRNVLLVWINFLARPLRSWILILFPPNKVIGINQRASKKWHLTQAS